MPLAAIGVALGATAGTAGATALGAMAVGGTAATLGASVYGANKQASTAKSAAQLQTDAANHAADVQGKAAADALAFQKDQAALDATRQDATQHANYDQWAAREGRIGSFGSLVGLPDRQIPAYVPLPTTTSPTGQPAPTSGPGAKGSQADLQALLASGVSPQEAAAKFNQQFGRTTGNEAVYYGDSGTVSIPEGYFSNGATGWQFAPRGAQTQTAPKTPYTVSNQPVGSFASLLTPSAPVVTPALQMPTVPYQPRSFGSLVNGYV